VVSAFNISLGFFNAENAEEDAEFAERRSKLQRDPLPDSVDAIEAEVGSKFSCVGLGYLAAVYQR